MAKSHVSIGDRFGKWVVLAPVTDNVRSMWRCRCDCGTERTIRSFNLTSGRSKSCGCAYKRKVIDVTVQDIEEMRRESLEILAVALNRCKVFFETADRIVNGGSKTRADMADCRRESSLLSRALVDWRNSCAEGNNPGSLERRAERRKRYERSKYASGELERNDPEERKAFYERLNTWARGLGR